MIKSKTIIRMLHRLGSRNDQTKHIPRVLIVIENMSFSYDTRMRKIARTLTDAGWQVSVICPHYAGDPYKTTIDNISVIFYPSLHNVPGLIGHLLEYGWSFCVITVLSLVSFIGKGFDVIHFCNPPDIFFPIGWIYRLFGRRFVFDQHDLCPELWNCRYGKWPIVYRLLAATERATLRTADQILVTSESARQRILSRSKTDESRITRVSNGPDLEKFPRPNWIPLNKTGVEVGYVGDMNPQDGISNLILAAHYIHHSLGRDDIKFTCIGDGSTFKACKDQATQLGVIDMVTFLGRLPPSQAMERLALCDICVQPDPKNPFTDSCVMVKSLEYMALGKAFVAFDLEETRRICGEAVLFAEDNSYRSLAHQIVRLADDSNLRIRLGQIGRSRIENELAWSFSRKILLELYSRLAQGLQDSTKTTIRESE